jgi:glucokinase
VRKNTTWDCGRSTADGFALFERTLWQAMRKTAYWLAIDIGGSSVKVALWDGHRLSRVDRTEFGSAIVDGDWIARLLGLKLQAWGDPPIRSAAVGVPSLVDAKHRVVVESANLGWRNYPLASVLRKALRILVYLETDVLLAARVESALGAGRNSTDFVYINLGTGVSHVRMLRGEPQLGAHGLGTNLGHAPLFSGRNRRARKLCRCDRPYCVETVIGGRVIATALRRWRGGERHRFWREYGENLGIVLSCVTSLLDPERIVLNGGVCASRTLFESSMRAALQRHTAHQGALPKILFSRLGDAAGLVGAGLAAQQRAHE